MQEPIRGLARGILSLSLAFCKGGASHRAMWRCGAFRRFGGFPPKIPRPRFAQHGLQTHGGTSHKATTVRGVPVTWGMCMNRLIPQFLIIHHSSTCGPAWIYQSDAMRTDICPCTILPLKHVQIVGLSRPLWKYGVALDFTSRLFDVISLCSWRWNPECPIHFVLLVTASTGNIKTHLLAH